MTSAARAREADRAAVAFTLALSKIGAATIEDALDLWQDMAPGAAMAAIERWHAEAIQMVLSYRTMSRDLALAYYRLIRALRTGHTVARPGEPVKKNVTLAELRREFGLLVRETDALYTGPATTAASLQESEDTTVVRARDDYNHLDHTEGNGDVIPEEPLDIEDDLRDGEQEALEEAEDVLATLGPENLDRKLQKVDDTKPAREVDAKRQEAHDEAGARQAAAAERLAMNGGRDVMHHVIHNDRRVIGYARYSTSGTPCGWCAMLIARAVTAKGKRGALYKSKVTAGDPSVTEKWHDNCKCRAEPVFSNAEIQSDRFALNREYAALWPEVTKGLTQKKAVAAWRRHFRAQARSRGEDN